MYGRIGRREDVIFWEQCAWFLYAGDFRDALKDAWHRWLVMTAPSNFNTLLPRCIQLRDYQIFLFEASN